VNAALDGQLRWHALPKRDAIDSFHRQVRLDGSIANSPMSSMPARLRSTFAHLRVEPDRQ
jgi:hypothetical protein